MRLNDAPSTKASHAADGDDYLSIVSEYVDCFWSWVNNVHAEEEPDGQNADQRQDGSQLACSDRRRPQP